WQDHDVSRRRSPESGTDAHIIGRDVCQKDALFLKCGLSDQAFAELEPTVDAFPIAISVACEQLELRFAVVSIYNIEDALLSRDHRCELGKNHSRDCEKISLALQHSTELREVR